MTDQTETMIEKTAETVAKPVEAVAAKVEKVAEKVAAPVKKTARKVAAKRTAAKARRTVKRKIKTTAKTAQKSKVEATKGIEQMTQDFTKLFAGYELPGMDKANELFAGWTEKNKDAVAKSRKAAEEMNGLAKANVEAIVESGKIAVSGVKSLGEEIVAKGKDGFNEASEGFKSLADAKTMTEYFQLQSEMARGQFDKMVAEGSQLTERMVKLAGEAMQPLQARASLNAQAAKEILA